MGLSDITTGTNGISLNAVVVEDRRIGIQASELAGWAWEDTLLVGASKDVIWLEGGVAGITECEDGSNCVSRLASILRE